VTDGNDASPAFEDRLLRAAAEGTPLEIVGGGSKSSHSRKHRCKEDYPKSRWRQKYEAKMNGKVEKESGDEGEVIIPDTE